MKSKLARRSARAAGLAALAAACLAIPAGAATYNNNFNGDPGAVLLLGSAVWVPSGGVDGSGFISITDALNDQQGSMFIEDFDGGVVGGFRAQFKLRMGGGTGNAADGFSFNWGAGITDALFGEEGTGNGLRVVFDIYDNGGGEAPAIDIYAGGAVIAHQSFSKADILTGDEFVDVRIELRDGLLDVDFKGQPVYTDLVTGLPPQEGARFALGARTGGENNNHWIDNLVIETFPQTAPAVELVRATGKGVTVRLNDAPSSALNQASVSATFDGQAVTGTTTKNGGVTVFNYTSPNLLEIGSQHTLVLNYTHGTPGVNASQTLEVTIPPYSVVPADLALPDGAVNTADRGFTWRVHQADSLTTLPNTTQRAEDQIAGLLGDNLADPSFPGGADGPASAPSPASAPITFTVSSVINFSQFEGDSFGNFTPDAAIPGISGSGGYDNIAGEAVAALEFPAAGMYVMGVNSDDGFKTTVGLNPRSIVLAPLGEFSGGRGASDTIFHFYIEAPGLYAFRTLWEEGNGDANVEWFTETDSLERVLVNDTASNAAAIKAYQIPAAALPAYVRSVVPPTGSSSLVRSETIEAVLVDAGTTVTANTVQMRLNGETVNATATKTGGETRVVYTVPGQLQANVTYTVDLNYTDSAGPQSVSWQFTAGPLSPNLFVIEAEDFDYDGGYTNPMEGVEGLDVNVMPYYGGAYDQLSAIEGIDFVNSDGPDSDQYRQEIGDDGDHEVNIGARDNVAPGNGLGGTYPINSSDRGAWTMQRNWAIGWVANGEWQNYTRVFPDYGQGNWWEVWAGLSFDGTSDGQLSGSLSLVTSGVGTYDQTTEPLGSFSAPGSGGWGNNNLVPMKTASGDIARVKLVGKQTVRFNLGSGDFDFLIFSPSTPPPPYVESAPQDSSTRDNVVLTWTLRNTDTQVNPSSVRVFFGGADVTSNATTTAKDNGYTVELDLSGQTFDPGEYAWRLEFNDTSSPAQAVSAQGTAVVVPYPMEGIFTVEAEDFNYSEDGVNGGLWNPQAGVEGLDVNVMPYIGGAYAGLSAVKGVDYNNADGNDSDIYRTELDENGENEVNIAASNGNRFSNDRGWFEVTDNYRIGWVAQGEWQNYTRVFPEGTFSVWAAMSYDGRGAGQLNGSLALVTSDPTKPNQTTSPLGTFNAPGSGGWGRNELVPMKNQAGEIAVVEMGGEQTIRFNLGSGDIDYILFVPASAPPPELRFTSVERNPATGAITVEWVGGGVLEVAQELGGEWQAVPGATSPYVFTPPAGQDKLFARIRR